MDSLKPCPFCGKSEAYITHNYLGQTYVRCPNCGATLWGPDDADWKDKDARNAWNRRANDEKL